ncbi:MAG: helix-turn-helix domain-containing protein [Bacteroidota bacterium]
MNISEILKNNPELAENLTIKVNASDLKEFAELCLNRGKQEKPEPTNSEEYLTPQQLADALQVSLVTLWSWDKKGITRPLRIGNAKRYRRSDLEKILCNT